MARITRIGMPSLNISISGQGKPEGGESGYIGGYEEERTGGELQKPGKDRAREEETGEGSDS
jgi:hypothetical protein